MGNIKWGEIQKKCSLRSCIPYLADLLLIIASLFWLADWTVIDRITNHNRVKIALGRLEDNGVLVRNSEGHPINSDDGTLIEPDLPSVSILIDFLSANYKGVDSIDWGHVCCLMYKSLKTPVENGNVVEFRTLEVGKTVDNKLAGRFAAVGSQNEVNHWLEALHQRNMELFIGTLMLLGFVLQIINRVLDRKK